MLRLLVTIVLVAATATLLPAASAHDCNGANCGACVKGEMHNHNDAKGQCSSGPGYYTDNGYGGQHVSPGTQVLGAIVALAGTALVVGVARRG